MPIPKYDELMLPLLEWADRVPEFTVPEASEHLAQRFGLTPEDLNERLPSGQETVMRNRTGWARTYLGKAGLLESPRRAHWRITSRGKDLLTRGLKSIDKHVLSEFESFVEFKTRTKEAPSPENPESSPSDQEAESSSTPEERIESAFNLINDALADDLLTRIHAMEPYDFEKLVVDLLVAMGYGGTHKDAAQAVGQSHDGGIDGVISEDRLGLDRIYLQAKRYTENAVGREAIQAFVGAIHGRGANKGVFITSSRFSGPASEYAAQLPTPRIILIDGPQLAALMIEHDLGVAPKTSFQLKDIDEDYFTEK